MQYFSTGTGNIWSTLAAVVGIVSFCLAAACGPQEAEQQTLAIGFRDIQVEPASVSKILALVSLGHHPEQEQLSQALRTLFTFLARTPPTGLVTTPAHGQGRWRIEKVLILDNCVAVQLTEGHYLETLLFVQNSYGWRLAARIRPQDQT